HRIEYRSRLLSLRLRTLGLEALRAVHRSVRARLERDARGLAAVAADHVVHVRRACCLALGLRALAAVRAALRLVHQAALLVELLLPRAPQEGIAALTARQRLVRERHPR